MSESTTPNMPRRGSLPADRIPGQIRTTARAIITHPEDGRLLVMETRDTVKDEVFFVPLGGGMWFGETAEETLRREVLEEIGAEVAECRLLTVLENHFEQEGRRGHEIVFVFAAALRDTDLESRESMTVIDGNNEHLQGSWRTLGSFRSALNPTRPPLFPEALTEWLRQNPGVVQ